MDMALAVCFPSEVSIMCFVGQSFLEIETWISERLASLVVQVRKFL